MHDVERRARDAGELDRAVRRLPLGLGRTRERVEVRRGVARRQRLLHEDVDRVAVLGVHHHERTRLGRNLHRPEERLVVDHERALVRHEELVRGDPLLRQSGKLFERAALAEIGDRDVVAHVDELLPLALGVPGVECLGERAPGRLDAEVDVTRGTAERCRDLARRDVVDRDGPAERHVEVRMRIDQSGEDVLARGVDDPVGIDVERLAEHRDALVLDEDVADVVVGGRDDPPALDQCRHVISPPSAESSGPAVADPEPTPRRYFPPSLSVTTAFLKPLPYTSKPCFFRFATAFFARSVRYDAFEAGFLMTLKSSEIFAVFA